MIQKEKTLLIIEDDKGIISILTAIFKMYNINALFAENGKSGISMFNNFAIDTVICDFMLPDINGNIVLEQIRKDEKKGQTPFIFLSAFADPEDVKMGLVAGADAYITKPFSTKQLIDTVKKYLLLNN